MPRGASPDLLGSVWVWGLGFRARDPGFFNFRKLMVKVLDLSTKAFGV